MLLDLLQEQLTINPKRATASKCIELGTTALKVYPSNHDLNWANLIYSRALRYLDLARFGETAHTDAAKGDLEKYLDWLSADDNVPNHLQRDGMTAFAKIDYAEALIIENQSGKATPMLEEAIHTLESSNSHSFITERAYELWNKAVDKR